MSKPKYQSPNDNPNPNAQMPKLPLPFNIPLQLRIIFLNLPLKVRGIKGVISIIPHNSPVCQRICSAGRPCPSYLKRGVLENFLKKGIF
jgi:hypothetical protein